MAGNADHPITSDDESFERDLNRHRGDELRRARAEASTRLRDRGIEVSASEPVEVVVDLLEAVEAFECAVQSQGGDLMMDTAPARQPDVKRFVLPKKRAEESLEEFSRRVRHAAQQIAAERAD